MDNATSRSESAQWLIHNGAGAGCGIHTQARLLTDDRRSHLQVDKTRRLHPEALATR